MAEKNSLSRIVSGGKRINQEVRKLRKRKSGVPLYPLNVEAAYRKELLSRLRYCRALVEKYLVPEIKKLHAELHAEREVVKQDAASDKLINILQNIRILTSSRFSLAATRQLANDVGSAASIFNLRQTTAAAKRVLGVDILLREPYLRDELQSFAFLNSKLISSVPEKYISDIESRVFDGFTAGDRAEGILSEMADTYGISERKAALIARDQVGKLNGELNMLRLQNLGSKKYEWMTVGDDRVRESHQEKDGEVFEWDNPPADTGHPGMDYNCRCIASPIFEDAEESDGNI